MEHRPTCWLLALWTLLMCGGVRAQETIPSTVHLDALASPQGWRATDARILKSTTLKAAERPTLHIRVPIESDAAGGGAGAWPKVWHGVGSDLGGDWKQFDRFEFLVMARFRPPSAVPVKTLSLQLLCPDKEHAASVTIPFRELDTWQRVSVPIREVPDLPRLGSMQLYLAKRRYAGIEMADFYVGGFRLVRDAGPVPGECQLLTPFPSPSQPVLRLEAPLGHAESSDATVPARIEKAGNVLHELSGRHLPSGHIVMDLTELKLSLGRYDLVLFPGQPKLSQSFAFEWQPFEWVSGDIGEGLVGDNIARVQVRNASAQTGSVDVSVRLDGTALATQSIAVPAHSIADACVVWPLSDGQGGKAELQVYSRDRYVGSVETVVKAVEVLGGAGGHRAVTFEAGRPAAFRVPVSLAAGSRPDARLFWELRDPSGRPVSRGETGIAGPFAELKLDPVDRWEAGRHTLHTRVRWGGNREVVAEAAILALPSPFSP